MAAAEIACNGGEACRADLDSSAVVEAVDAPANNAEAPDHCLDLGSVAKNSRSDGKADLSSELRGVSEEILVERDTAAASDKERIALVGTLEIRDDGVDEKQDNFKVVSVEDSKFLLDVHSREVDGEVLNDQLVTYLGSRGSVNGSDTSDAAGDGKEDSSISVVGCGVFSSVSCGKEEPSSSIADCYDALAVSTEGTEKFSGNVDAVVPTEPEISPERKTELPSAEIVQDGEERGEMEKSTLEASVPTEDPNRNLDASEAMANGKKQDSGVIQDTNCNCIKENGVASANVDFYLVNMTTDHYSDASHVAVQGDQQNSVNDEEVREHGEEPSVACPCALVVDGFDTTVVHHHMDIDAVVVSNEQYSLSCENAEELEEADVLTPMSISHHVVSHDSEDSSLAISNGEDMYSVIHEPEGKPDEETAVVALEADYQFSSQSDAIENSPIVLGETQQHENSKSTGVFLENYDREDENVKSLAENGYESFDLNAQDAVIQNKQDQEKTAFMSQLGCSAEIANVTEVDTQLSSDAPQLQPIIEQFSTVGTELSVHASSPMYDESGDMGPEGRSSDDGDDSGGVENGHACDISIERDGEHDKKSSAADSELSDNCHLENQQVNGYLTNDLYHSDEYNVDNNVVTRSGKDCDTICVGGVVILKEYMNGVTGATKEYVSSNGDLMYPESATRGQSPHIDVSREIDNHFTSIVDDSANEQVVIDDDQYVHKGTGASNRTIEKLESPSDVHFNLSKGDQQLPRQRRVFIIKVPRFSDDEFWARIQDAQSDLDEKTQIRDQCRVPRKEKEAYEECRKQLDIAKSEERAARAQYNAKKQELSNAQSVMKKLDKVVSIDDIEAMIEMKERSLQHETMTLKQEKLLIHEIKELKVHRNQLCSNMGPMSEIDDAVEQREQILERIENLRKELNSMLYNTLKPLELKAKEAQKNFDDAQVSYRNSKAQYEAANNARQAAYAFWRDLKNESRKKSEHFFKFKNHQKTISKYASSGDRAALVSFCNNQVEEVMGLWNNDENFRGQYVEANKYSTVRRLETLDGRSLSPGEVPPVLPARVNLRVSSPLPSTVLTPTMQPKSPELVHENRIALAASRDEGPSTALKELPVRRNSEVGPISKEAFVAPLSGKQEVSIVEKEKINKVEERVLSRNIEELQPVGQESKQEKSAEEKERLRLEQKAKAKEAEERKKRQAEKAQERAEYRARKEAETREKKKAKKERKKAPDSIEGVSDGSVCVAASSGPNYTENHTAGTSSEMEIPSSRAAKRPLRPVRTVKVLNRVVQPVPLPLRNRGKRKMRAWILAGVAVVSALALFAAAITFSSWRPLLLK